MNVYRYEVRKNLLANLIWAVALSLFIWMYLSVYAALGEDINRFVDTIPKDIIRALSWDKLTSFIGYYHSIVGLILLLGFSIQGCIYGIGMFTKDYKEQVIDFLYVMPKKRMSIVSAKLFAGMTGIFVNAALIFIATVTLIMFYRFSLDWKIFILLHVGYLLTTLFCYILGFLIGIIIFKIQNHISWGVSIALLLYGIKLVQQFVEKEWLTYFSPLQYFIADIYEKGTMNGILATVGGLLILSMVGMSYWFFTQKNL